MRIGVIGLSFALRKGQEPNSCNVRLAREFQRIVTLLKAEGQTVLGSLQWEINLALDPYDVNVIHVARKHRVEGSYLDSDEVILQAVEAFKASGGVDEVVIIANPWIHLQGARSKARGFGLRVKKVKIRWIGFDKKSDQWQARGPARAFAYTVGRVLFGRFGQKK